VVAGLNLFQAVIVVDVLRRIVKIDEDLCVAIWQEPIDAVSMLDAFEVGAWTRKIIFGARASYA
jgi:hypothetical protein